MFTADEIQARVKQQPFVPLRIITSAGEAYDIYHPDLIMVGRRSLQVGTASSDNPSQYEQVARIALLHITALENLPVKVPPGKNGQQ